MGLIIKFLFGFIFAYWALGALLMVIRASFSNEGRNELKQSKLLVFGGGFVSAILAIILLSSGFEQCSGGNDNEYYQDRGYSPSFKGGQTGYTGPCKIKGCDCPGGYERTANGKCSNCKHSWTDHTWHN